MQIPYSMEQGIILVEQGNLAQEQGILLAKTEIHRRMRFSVHTGAKTSSSVGFLLRYDTYPRDTIQRFVKLTIGTGQRQT
jgi:hypothetical protein